MNEEAYTADAVGTTFKELRGLIKARFPQQGGLGLADFLDVESVLALAREVAGPDFDAKKADRLLANYPLLRPGTLGRREHLMQMARRSLLRLSSAGSWHRYLDLYLKDDYETLRFYDVDGDGRISVRERPYGGADRGPVYLRRILDYETRPSATGRAKAGGLYTYRCTYEKNGGEKRGCDRQVTVPAGTPAPSGETPSFRHKGRREKITVTLAELIAVADEAADGDGHYAGVLRAAAAEGLLKQLTGAEAIPAQELTLDRVTNLVGLVGAGKSALATTLIVVLARRGYRVAALFNSVSDVLDCVRTLRAFGVSASPLIARGNRLQRLNEQFAENGGMLLDDAIARYLETPCILDGLSHGDPDACGYASTPCHSLAGAKWGRSTCPYWEICPSQAMEREALTSSVVVTTPNGFAKMGAGPRRALFLEEVLGEFDVVIFDEADRIQAQLDDSFAPEMSLQELIRKAATPTYNGMTRRPDEKMHDRNVERYFDLCPQSAPVASVLLSAAGSREVSGWKAVKDEAFTSWSLVQDLAEQGLDGAVVRDLLAHITREGEQNPWLEHAIDTSCQRRDEGVFRFALDAYLQARGVELGDELRARLSFALKVMGFEAYLDELADASELSGDDDSLSELYNFLRFRNARQQRYLPSSPIGNMVGFAMSEGNDLKLFRQFAFGRALMESLPWLDTDEEGRPLGPRALLLSGSSYEPGCLPYHVNRPVDYLLEAEPRIPRRLSGSVMRDVGLDTRVSGCPDGKRQENLRRVLFQSADVLASELDANPAGKILLIVNSYEQADTAQGALEDRLRKAGRNDGVCALVRKPRGDASRFLPRSEVSRFAHHPARILIAPALAVERGYNIVDDIGHAAFGTIVFCVRPMGVPFDIGLRFQRLSGLIDGMADRLPADPADFALAVRREAWKTWKMLGRDERMMPRMWRATGRDVLARDTAATLMVTIVQLFGRLARIRDFGRPVPHVYFADAAFRGGDDPETPAFRTFDELDDYLEWLVKSSGQPLVAQALYGPFYTAYKKGVMHARHD